MGIKPATFCSKVLYSTERLRFCYSETNHFQMKRRAMLCEKRLAAYEKTNAPVKFII